MAKPTLYRQATAGTRSCSRIFPSATNRVSATTARSCRGRFGLVPRS